MNFFAYCNCGEKLTVWALWSPAPTVLTRLIGLIQVVYRALRSCLLYDLSWLADRVLELTFGFHILYNLSSLLRLLVLYLSWFLDQTLWPATLGLSLLLNFILSVVTKLSRIQLCVWFPSLCDSLICFCYSLFS